MLEVQAPQTFDLPCPWAPLQSVAAAASREFPYRRVRAASLQAEPPSRSERRATSPVSEHTPEGVQPEPLSPCGQARPTAEPECSRQVVFTLCRSVAEAAVRYCAPSQVMAPRANMVATSFTGTRAEAQERCFLGTWSAAEATNPAPKLPFWRLTAEAVSTREGSSGEWMCDSTRRSGLARAPSPEGCLPPAGHQRCTAGARHAAGIQRRLPWGSIPFGV